MAKRRIMKELDEITKNPMEGITAEPVAEDIFHWRAKIHGPAGTDYEGGIFVLDIHFPFDYPLKPPKCNFETKVYHPNIGSKGEICLDILKKEWKPIENIKNVLQNIYFLFETPDPDDALSTEIASQYKNDLPAFKKTAVEWTKLYASGQ